MPWQLHEVLLELFHNRPLLAPELLRDALHVELPKFLEARIDSADGSGSDIGPAQIFVRDNLFRVVTSAKYDIGGGWSADFYYQYGHNKFRSDLTNNTITANITRALDATTLNGQPVCRVNADAGTANDDPACVPLNPFGFANGSTFLAAKDYVTGEGFQTNVTTEHVVAANITGNLIDLPAGPLGVAVGAEYRNDDVNGNTDPISQKSGFFNTGNGALVSGQIAVSEVYGEVEIPLLRDLSFTRELSLSGAARPLAASSP